ncbi:magnesium transporter CorA family protein [Patescibacteria group bacterium]|nr:magnesium transporter CorA family protein [Patescibacteria group bacterium]MBU1921652.1 magnesium transporter CorA family protein [Patescibacteria group bacterium]
MPKNKPENKNIEQIKQANLTWVNIKKPGKQEMAEAARKYNLLDVDIKDCLPPLQRPKLVERPDYLFMVLLFPVYVRATGKMESAEVDFFISKNRLITVHENKLTPLKELAEECQVDPGGICNNAASLLVEILSRLLKYCYPMIIHIGQDIDAVEKKVFEVHDSKNTFEILRIKINIVEFRDSTDLHEGVIRKLIKKAPLFLETKRLNAYLDSLVEHATEIRDQLASYAVTISAVDDTHRSLINLRANQIMKNLQIFAVIVFPLTLLAAVFGMNTLGAMPFINHAYGFWLILGIMLAGTFAMVMFFKSRKWF